MVHYQVKDPQGQLHVIDGPEGASPNEVLQQAQSLVPNASSSSQQPQGKPQDWISKVYTPAIEGGAMTLGGAAGAIMGAPAGPITSGLAGVAGGAAMFPPAKRFAASIDQMRGIDNPVNQPKPLFQQAKDIASDTGEGVAMEAGGRLVNAGAEAAAPYAKSIFGWGAKKMSKLGSIVSGAKPNDLMTAYNQGLKTYSAPSMEEAGNIFQGALQKEGIANKIPVDARYDPQLTYARDYAHKIVTKMEAGEQLTAEEALRGKQSISRVIDGTPMKDKSTIAQMVDDSNKLDEILSNQSGNLKDASNTYRKAIVKRNLLSPVPVNKNGSPNKLTSTLFGLAGAFSKGSEGGEGALTMPIKAGASLIGMSPLAQGAGAAVTGDAVRGAGNFLSSPMGGKTIAAAVGDKILNESKAREYLKKANGDKEKAREMAKADDWSF